jgi:F-box/leucine-rich repeat protein 10/11
MLEGKKVKDNNFRRMKGSDVGLEWLESDDSAMQEPFIVESPDGLGMKMPDGDFSIEDVAEAVGEETPVEVIGTCILPLL